MNHNDLHMLTHSTSVRGNVALRWLSRNATAIALAAALVMAWGPTTAVGFAEAASSGFAITQEAPAPIPAESTAVFEKSEVVYADLSDYGQPLDEYVVNRFDVEEGGMIVDYGEYSSTKNLTDTKEVVSDDGANAVHVDEGTFFYQGNLKTALLPWDIALAYELDGETIQPQDLAGKSGALHIGLTTRQDTNAPEGFYDSFMLQATFTLDSAKCSHIKADGATVADAGANQSVAFTVLPGHDGDFSIDMDVVDFEMAGVQIVGLPYTSPIEVPDTSGMAEGMEELASGVNKVAQGSSQLAGNGSSLAQGADALTSGIEQAKDGASSIGAAGSTVLQGTESMGEAISQQAKGLKDLSDQLEAMSTLVPESIRPQIERLKEAVAQMSAGMAQLDGSYSEYESGVGQYVAGVDGLESGLDELEAGSSALADGIRKYISGSQELNAGIQALDGETSKLPAEMQSQIDSMLAEFDFPEYASTSFVSPENAHVRAVQFVMTTPDIVIQVEDEPVPEEEPDTFADRLFGLFN